MSEFLAMALAFPAVVFSFALVVVVLYWLLVLLGGADLDLFDSDSDVDVDTGSGGSGGFAGFLNSIGLGGVPITVAGSLLITFAWLISLVGTVLVAWLHIGGFLSMLLSIAVLIVALTAGLLCTRVVVLPIRRLFPEVREQSRNDFVGRLCVIRTGNVGADFGQAEVTSDDGSSAVIQVRQSAKHFAEHPLRSGQRAVIYHYDPAAEVFWVAAEPALTQDNGDDPPIILPAQSPPEHPQS